MHSSNVFKFTLWVRQAHGFLVPLSHFPQLTFLFDNHGWEAKGEGKNWVSRHNAMRWHQTGLGADPSTQMPNVVLGDAAAVLGTSPLFLLTFLGQRQFISPYKRASDSRSKKRLAALPCKGLACFPSTGDAHVSVSSPNMLDFFSRFFI